MTVRERSIMIGDEKNTYHLLLCLLSYTGDVGISIYRLMEMEYGNWYRVINRMMDEKTYRVEKDGDIIKLQLCRKTAPRHYPISYSLTQDACRSGILDSLGFQYQMYYDAYHAHTREHTKASIRAKNIQLAEMTVILHHFDTLIYPHEKNIPELFFDERFESFRLSPEFIPPAHNVFYSSVEIKRYYEYLHKKVSRINIARGIYRGLWIMDNRVYISYYQSEKPLKRNYISEKRTTIMAEEFIQSATPCERTIRQNIKQSIIFGKRGCLKALKEMLQDPDNVGMSLYDYEHYVPIEHYKEVIPWIVCENYEKFVNEHIIKSKVPYDKSKFWHGINRNNERTVCLLDFNLTLIQKLKLVAEQSSGEKYRAICYEWQAPLLKEYFEGTVKISVLNKLPDNLYKQLNIKSDLQGV